MKEIVQIKNFSDGNISLAAGTTEKQVNDFLETVDSRDIISVQKYIGSPVCECDYYYGGILVVYKKQVKK